MRTIHVQDAKADMIVTKDIYNSDGKVLVAKGVKLTERYIERLRDFNIKSIEIVEEPERIEEQVEMIDSNKQTKQELELLINHSIRRLIKTNARKQDLMLLVEEIFEIVLEDSVVIENMFKMKVIGDGTFFHAVQVAVLSVATGFQLDVDKPSLIQLGKASLLYDIGKCFLGQHLLMYPLVYDEIMHMTMREHTISGYMLLQSQFPEEIAAVALQHHERFNGTGYPRKLTNNQIHLFSRIVSVADVYVSLKSHRSYRAAYQPYESLEYVLGAGDYLFDSRVVNAFNEIVVIYALGSVVQINDGRTGIVSGIHRTFTQRPEVTLLFDEQRLPIAHEVVDLSRSPTSFITRVLHD